MVTIATVIAVSSVITIIVDALGFYPSAGAPNYKTISTF